MGFLGYSFACSIVKTTARRGLVAILLGVPPASMLAASALACAGASGLEDTAAFCGLIAFALVALLFLVFQELLLEAHENGEEGWHIGIWLYVGLLMSIVVDVIL